MITKLLFCFAVTLSLALGQADFPAKVDVGENFELNWRGGSEGRLAVLKKDADGKPTRSGGFIYLRANKASYKVTAPVEPGDYFIGKLDGDDWVELKALEVVDVEASLTAPDEVEINQAFEVEWSGPTAGTVISIHQAAMEEQKAKRFAYTYPGNAKGKTVTLKSPLESGSYEIRYMLGDRMLTSRPIQVGGASATLAGEPMVAAGSELVINWSGPIDAQNKIGFAKAGAAKTSGHYRYVPNIEGNAVTLVAPEELGDYEVVFMIRSKVVARHPVKVVPATATLEASEEVTEFTNFKIHWNGPGNRGDSITAEDAEGNRKSVVFLMSEDQTKSGVAELKAPAAGRYTLQYQTNKKKVLVELPITVKPAPQKPGTLVVKTHEVRSFGPNSAVEVILDASGSMLQRQGEKRRIKIAKESLMELLGDTIPEDTPFALRVFGHKEANTCRTDLEIPLQPLDVAAAKSKISSINAMNLAKTPIAASLLKTRDDLNGVSGERIIILLTDGEETCDGDPLASIELLKEAGTDVRVNVVGYAIDDVELQETFQIWAAVGNGQYLNAPDADQLSMAMKQALQLPFEITQNGDVVESSITGAHPLTLPAGDYQLGYRWDGGDVKKAVTIEPEKETEISIP